MIRSRYAALRALAEDQAGTPEGDTAARLADRLLERCPDLDATPVEIGSRTLAARHEFDSELLGSVAAFLGLEAFRIGRRRADGKGTRWRAALELRGPPVLLDLAADLYQAHRDRLDELLIWTARGYAAGAFPVEPVAPPSGREAAPLAPELADAAAAGLAAGGRHQATPPRRLLTGEG